MKGLLKSLTSLKITPPLQNEVFRIVSGVLHLGNIKLKPVTADSVEVEPGYSQQMLKEAAELFDSMGIAPMTAQELRATMKLM